MKYVSHDVDREFPFYFADYHRKFDATVKVLQSVDTAAAAQAQRAVSALTYELDDINRSLQPGFRYLYGLYSTDPCALHGLLVEHVVRLVEGEQRARYYFGALDRILRSVEAGMPPENAVALVDSVVQSLQISAPLTNQKMAAATDLVDRWQDGGPDQPHPDEEEP